MTALDRVEESRARLRQALAPPPEPAQETTRPRRFWLGGSWICSSLASSARGGRRAAHVALAR